jgi:hypothetical protein
MAAAFPWGSQKGTGVTRKSEAQQGQNQTRPSFAQLADRKSISPQKSIGLTMTQIMLLG